ncbi:hypothetical protein TWF281_003247 [Arthrobotrys megalospora]
MRYTSPAEFALLPLLNTNLPSYHLPAAVSPPFYASDNDEESIYPDEHRDPQDYEYDSTGEGDIAVLHCSTFDITSGYPRATTAEDGNSSCLLFTHFDDVPVDLRSAWVEQFGVDEGYEGDADDSEIHEIEIATVGRVIPANTAAVVNVDGQ